MLYSLNWAVKNADSELPTPRGDLFLHRLAQFVCEFQLSYLSHPQSFSSAFEYFFSQLLPYITASIGKQIFQSRWLYPSITAIFQTFVLWRQWNCVLHHLYDAPLTWMHNVLVKLVAMHSTPAIAGSQHGLQNQLPHPGAQFCILIFPRPNCAKTITQHHVL